MFGAEFWSLSDAMIRKVYSNHVGFLCHIMGKRVIRKDGGSWDTLASKELIWVVGIQSASTYIGLWRAKVAQWVVLRPLLEFCARETGYKGGGRKRRPWWNQGATLEVISTTLEEAYH